MRIIQSHVLWCSGWNRIGQKARTGTWFWTRPLSVLFWFIKSPPTSCGCEVVLTVLLPLALVAPPAARVTLVRWLHTALLCSKTSDSPENLWVLVSLRFFIHFEYWPCVNNCLYLSNSTFKCVRSAISQYTSLETYLHLIWSKSKIWNLDVVNGMDKSLLISLTI